MFHNNNYDKRREMYKRLKGIYYENDLQMHNYDEIDFGQKFMRFSC